MIEAYALTGVIIRGSKIKKDLRLLGYEYYSNIEFGVITGVKGDCLERYLIRMNECLESVKIIQQLNNEQSPSPHHCNLIRNNLMELMIHRFIFGLSHNIVHGQTYLRQEAPKGELGFYIVSDNTNKVYRVKIRSPD